MLYAIFLILCLLIVPSMTLAVSDGENGKAEKFLAKFVYIGLIVVFILFTIYIYK